MSKNKKLLKVISIISGVMLVIYLCYMMYDIISTALDPEYLKERVDGTLYFDPETILLTLDVDEVSFYDEPVLTENERSDVVFSYEEYMNMYKKIHLYVWDEPIDMLKGDMILLRGSCDNLENGFFLGKINLFTIRKNPSKLRIFRTIVIFVDEGIVYWGEDTYSGHLGKGGSLDLYNLKMSPLEVIKKAELEGFSCQSLKLEEDADIDIAIGAGRFLGGWNVIFDHEYELILDKETGEIIYRDLPE